MSRDDSAYFAQRALEERRLAMASANLAARRIHLELAAKYALLAGSKVKLGQQPPAKGKQRTAETG